MYYSLIFGFIIFYGVHILTGLQQTRANLIIKFGEINYKILFSLISTIGFILILLPSILTRTETLPLAASLIIHAPKIIWFSIMLMVAGYIPKNHIKYFLVHPFILGIGIYSFIHFLIISNLEARLFFLCLAVFAFLMYIQLILRDFNKEKMKPILTRNLIVLGASMAIFYTLAFLHHYITEKNIWSLL